MVPENIHTLEIPRGMGATKANIFIGKKLNWNYKRGEEGGSNQKKKQTNNKQTNICGEGMDIFWNNTLLKGLSS